MLSTKTQIDRMAYNGSCTHPTYRWSCEECCIRGWLCKQVLKNNLELVKSFASKVQDNNYDIDKTIFEEVL